MKMYLRGIWITVLWGMLFTLEAFPQAEVRSISGNIPQLAASLLELSPSLQQQTLRIRQATTGRILAASAFDVNLYSNVRFDYDQSQLHPNDLRTESTGGNLDTRSLSNTYGVQRQFRNGLISRVETSYGRISNNYPFDAYGVERPAQTADNTLGWSVSLVQPLLQGRGKSVVAANEQIAHQQVRKAKWDYTSYTSQLIVDMLLGYWDYYGRYREQIIFEENRNRVQQLLEMTTELVRADRKAATDLNQIQADLLDKERQLLAAKQRLYESRLNLARVIGLEFDTDHVIGDPEDEFPTLELAHYSPNLPIDSLVALALRSRPDLKSLYLAQRQLDIQYQVERNRQLPQLDLVTSWDYLGASTGNQLSRIASPLIDPLSNSHLVSVGINFVFPANNRAAKANVANQKLAIEYQEVEIANKIREIELNLGIALNHLDNTVDRLEKAFGTLQYYQKVYADEQVKFQNGMTTLLNLILFQERLTFSQLDYLSSQREFARAIILLRWETGTLVPQHFQSGDSLNPSMFVTLPTF
ncbi:TolC family protein [Pontibacter sp. G13]|uniref:TolC family protein n=1 Tax=Pontibacter sp. G13 TaxID=3074898 RepID=UPI00288C6040|nr:TolC family protein [Pontibacter sp. G13]WNJ16373.1 TolC family protein [Pontibacter sp. G13]